MHRFYICRGTAQDGLEAFRQWYGRIGEVRSLLPGCAMLAMTATASRHIRMKVSKQLCLNDPMEIVDNPDRCNIKLFVHRIESKETDEDVFQWCINLILCHNDTLCSIPRVLVFGRTIKECSRLYGVFLMQLDSFMMRHVEMFHSHASETAKDMIRSDMQTESETIRVIIYAQMLLVWGLIMLVLTLL